jgi:hypothetical protein
MKIYRRVDIQIHVVLTSALVVGEWSASHPGLFNPGKGHEIHIGYEVGWTPQLVRIISENESY